MNIVEILHKIEEIRKKGQSINKEAPGIKNNPKAIKAIEQRETQGRIEAQIIKEKLLTDIQEIAGKKGVLLLKKLLKAFGLEEDKSIGLGADHYVLESEFAEVYDHELYEKILPVCQLAYVFEENGVAEEHAFKLSILTNHLSDEVALSKISLYLRRFENSNATIRYPLHDACLFDLPFPSGTFDFKRWQNYAMPAKGLPLLLNVQFREVLPHAEQIEKIETELSEKTVKPDKALIKPLENEVQRLAKEFKTIQKGLGKASEEEKQALQTRLKAVSSEKSKTLLNLANLYREQKFDGKNIIMLQAFYQKYRSESSAAYAILIQYGISQKNIGVFFNLPRRNDDSAIPNVKIDGEVLGYKGYYLKKLDIESDKGAAWAACLGKITDCCQYLGGVGNDCVIHGISSPNGGFYVMCRQEGESPSIDDEIVAQTWAWRSRDNALCFDSIESSIKVATDIVATLYRYLGFHLCTSKDFPGCPVTHVNTGATSGVTKQVSLMGYPATKEYHQDYTGYSDAESQLKLADSRMPYIFYGKAQGLFKEKIEEQSKLLFEEQFKNPLPLSKNEVIKEAIAFIFYGYGNGGHTHVNQELLHCLENAGQARKKELAALVEVNKEFIDKLNANQVDLPLLDKGAYLNALNPKGLSALHIAVLNQDVSTIQTLLNHPGINVAIPDKEGVTPLIKAIDIQILHKFIPAILEKIPKNERLAAVLKENQDGNTVLNLLVFKHKLLQAVLSMIPEEDRLTAVLTPDRSDEWVLRLAAADLKSFRIILSLIPEKDLLSAIYAIKFRLLREPKLLKIALGLLTEKDHLALISSKDHDGNTILHMVFTAANPESLEAVLSLYPKKNRLAGVLMKNKAGKTVLDMAESKPESLQVILRLIPENQRIEFLKTTLGNDTVCNLFSDLSFNSFSFKVNVGLEDSFAPDYIGINWILNGNRQPNRANFFSSQVTETLLKEFNRAQTFDEVKKVLINFLSDDKNQQSSIAKTLLLWLVPGKEKTLEALCLKWNIQGDNLKSQIHLH